MIFGILIIGLLLIATALKGTEHELGQQLVYDFIGASGFIAWVGAILAIGAIGYIPGLRSPSRWMLALLATVMVVRNGGVFSQAQAALQGVSAAGPAPSIPVPSSQSSSGSGSSSGGDSGGGLDIGTVAQVAAIALL